MSLASPSTLLVAGLLASPTLYHALAGSGDVSLTDAATRYLICVPVAAVMLWLLRSVTRDFGRSRTTSTTSVARRRSDQETADREP
jgi:hypothetical protein